MDQIALPSEDATHSIAYVPADLRHPEPIRRGGNASDLDSARREMRKKRTKNRSSPCRVPHLDREEIGSDDQFPVTPQKLLPGCLAAAFGGRFDPVALQDFRDGAARDAMTEIDQRLGCARSPSRDSRGLSGSPKIRSRRQYADVLAHVARCRRISGQSVSDAMPSSVSGVTIVAISRNSFLPIPSPWRPIAVAGHR